MVNFHCCFTNIHFILVKSKLVSIRESVPANKSTPMGRSYCNETLNGCDESKLISVWSTRLRLGDDKDHRLESTTDRLHRITHDIQFTSDAHEIIT